jgi:alpha-tubulin suppressor-like RCC1 family protein
MTLRAAVLPALAALAMLAGACSDGAKPVDVQTTPPDTLAGLIVSPPVSAPGGASGSVRGLSAGPPAGGSVVYVSLVPGTVPAGLQATVRNPATGQIVTTAVVAGGFDPVAIPASVGDTLVVEITRSGGAETMRATEPVRTPHPPVVVRTSPPRGGRDVPLNAIVVLVFSEPLDSATADRGSVQLWQGTTPIPGTVRFADAAHLRAEFHPDSLLAPQTAYQVVLTTAIRDLNGLALDSAVTVSFTTGTLVPVANLVFASVSAGFQHTCGVTTTGGAYCWGSNSGWALGDGTSGDGSTTPVPVAGGLTFAAVSAGFQHTCGVTTSGAAYCWGVGSDDSLGNTSLTPVPVAGGLTFASVSAGFVHDCGVTTGGAAYCWGEGYYGELGNGTTTGYSSTPVPVAGGLAFQAVSAGYSHSCGVTTAGVAYCWGQNTLGELGFGTSAGPEECVNGDTLACSTTPVSVAGGLTFAAVSAGEFGTCGVTTGGAGYCWGDNRFGLLDTDPATGPEQCPLAFDWDYDVGPIACSLVPVRVADGLTFASVSASQQDLGACALTSSGDAYCWGELVDSRTTPVAIPGGLSFATTSIGVFHTCGVTTTGVAYCWGQNTEGELGDGTTTPSDDVPVKVAGQR